MILNSGYTAAALYDEDHGLTARQLRFLAEGVERKESMLLSVVLKAFSAAGPVFYYGPAAAFAGGKAGDALNDKLTELHQTADRLHKIGLGLQADLPKKLEELDGPLTGRRGLPDHPLYRMNVPHLINPTMTMEDMYNNLNVRLM